MILQDVLDHQMGIKIGPGKQLNYDDYGVLLICLTLIRYKAKSRFPVQMLRRPTLIPSISKIAMALRE